METVLERDTTVLELEPDPQAGNGRNSEGSFVTLKDGRILFAYTKYIGRNHNDHAPSMIVGRYSSDGGRSWTSEDRVFIERGEANNVMSVSLLRLQNDRILMLYCRKVMLEDGIVCLPWICFSDDETETFSEPKPLFRSLTYNGVVNDRMIQLRDGRLVIPITCNRMGFVSRETSDGFTLANDISESDVWTSEPSIVYYLLSDDNGQNWFESPESYYRAWPGGNGLPHSLGLQEPGVVELNDGRLLSWTRTWWSGEEAHPRQWQAFSEDRGLTWSEPQPSEFVSPCSPLHMKRIPSTGDLLAVWNDHSGRFPLPEHFAATTWERTPFASAISRDEGETWEHHTLLEDDLDHGFCYAASHFVDDAVLLAYCAGGASTRIPLDKIRMRRIPLAELYQRASPV